MLLRAHRPQGTEPAIVVRAGRHATLRVDVQIQTLFAIGAVSVPRKKVALGHLAEVILVQELALLTLLAQAAKPVLADERIEAGGVGAATRPGGHGVADVPLKAFRSVGAVARGVGFTYRPVGWESVVVDLAEEGREMEGVWLGRVVEDNGGVVLDFGRRHSGRSAWMRVDVEKSALGQMAASVSEGELLTWCNAFAGNLATTCRELYL